METDKQDNLIPVLLKNEKLEHLVVYKKYESPAGFKPWWKTLCETLSNKWIVFGMIIVFTIGLRAVCRTVCRNSLGRSAVSGIVR